jgi:hypothetical protein
VYDNGKLHYSENDIKAVDEARARLLETFQLLEYPTIESSKTQTLRKQVRARLTGNISA